MKITLTTQGAVDHLLRGGERLWTRNGARALVAHLERLEEESGKEMTLDVIELAIRFEEYATALNYVADNELEDCATEAEAMAFLESNTTVLEFEGGIIVERF